MNLYGCVCENHVQERKNETNRARRQIVMSIYDETAKRLTRMESDLHEVINKLTEFNNEQVDFDEKVIVNIDQKKNR